MTLFFSLLCFKVENQVREKDDDLLKTNNCHVIGWRRENRTFISATARLLSSCLIQLAYMYVIYCLALAYSSKRGIHLCLTLLFWCSFISFISCGDRYVKGEVNWKTLMFFVGLSDRKGRETYGIPGRLHCSWLGEQYVWIVSMWSRVYSILTSLSFASRLDQLLFSKK